MLQQPCIAKELAPSASTARLTAESVYMSQQSYIVKELALSALSAHPIEESV